MTKQVTNSNKVSRESADTFIFPKFSLLVHKMLFDVYPKTFIVGGAVRNMLLQKKIADVDIATEAIPQEVITILQSHNISFNDDAKKFGVIVASKGSAKIDITTFRKDLYTKSRFPSVRFTKNAQIDSKRRDFTVNALYYNPITKEVLDYHNGLLDLQNRQLKFINNIEKKIHEDPLRIVRAYKYALLYNLSINTTIERALQKNILLLQKINATRVQKEIATIKNKKVFLQLQKVIHNLS